MTQTARASRRVLASATCPSTDSIWISECLLAESFHRFTCIQTRHGSNVPGPMEARRRANKRRNTNMAQVAASPIVDPNVLFGAGPQNAWWQSSNPASPNPPIDPGKEGTSLPMTLLSGIYSASTSFIMARPTCNPPIYLAKTPIPHIQAKIRAYKKQPARALPGSIEINQQP